MIFHNMTLVSLWITLWKRWINAALTSKNGFHVSFLFLWWKAAFFIFCPENVSYVNLNMIDRCCVTLLSQYEKRVNYGGFRVEKGFDSGFILVFLWKCNVHRIFYFDLSGHFLSTLPVDNFCSDKNSPVMVRSVPRKEAGVIASLSSSAEAMRVMTGTA